MRRNLWWRGALLALALSPVLACSHGQEAVKSNISQARLEGVPQSEMSEVTAARQQLQAAQQDDQRAQQDVRDVQSQIDLAKSDEKSAKLELDRQKKMATNPVQVGAEQRTAAPAPVPPPEPVAPPSGMNQPNELQPNAAPPPAVPPPAVPPQAGTNTELGATAGAAPYSDLHLAEMRDREARLRHDYLEQLENFATARRSVADKRLQHAQARLDEATFDTLQRTRPQEAATLEHQGGYFARKTADAQGDVASSRAQEDVMRSKAITAYNQWLNSWEAIPAPDRKGSPAPAPDTLAPF